MDTIVLLFLLLLGTLLLLRSMGRKWGPTNGGQFLWTPSTNSSSTSQVLFDPYTFSHVLHGIVFYWFLTACFPQLSLRDKLLISTALEALWEIAENTPAVINQYRKNTASLGYEGDSILNSLADIASMLVGFGIASKLSGYASLTIFLSIEVAMMYYYRDNLLLNIIMLLSPSETIKKWQLQGEMDPGHLQRRA
jgi:hypothetical protein